MFKYVRFVWVDLCCSIFLRIGREGGGNFVYCNCVVFFVFLHLMVF